MQASQPRRSISSGRDAAILDASAAVHTRRHAGARPASATALQRRAARSLLYRDRALRSARAATTSPATSPAARAEPPPRASAPERPADGRAAASAPSYAEPAEPALHVERPTSSPGGLGGWPSQSRRVAQPVGAGGCPRCRESSHRVRQLQRELGAAQQARLAAEQRLRALAERVERGEAAVQWQREMAEGLAALGVVAPRDERLGAPPARLLLQEIERRLRQQQQHQRTEPQLTPRSAQEEEEPVREEVPAPFTPDRKRPDPAPGEDLISGPVAWAAETEPTAPPTRPLRRAKAAATAIKLTLGPQLAQAMGTNAAAAFEKTIACV